jgi:hypothetical protein
MHVYSVNIHVHYLHYITYTETENRMCLQGSGRLHRQPGTLIGAVCPVIIPVRAWVDSWSVTRYAAWREQTVGTRCKIAGARNRCLATRSRQTAVSTSVKRRSFQTLVTYFRFFSAFVLILPGKNCKIKTSRRKKSATESLISAMNVWHLL